LHIKVYNDDERKAFINESASSEASRLVVAVPYKLIPIERVWDMHLREEVPEVVLKGHVEFFIDIVHEEINTADGKRMIP